ncbi:MAG: radical SAM protein [Candidatus Omnitrophota bacterium]
MKIVAANSIGVDKNGYHIIHSPSRWSEGVKSKYHWFAYYPWELAYASSLLKLNTDYNVKFLDGCLERLNSNSYYERILKEKPDFLVMESATRMIDENLSLALKIKKILGTKLIFTGQHASAFPEQLKALGIDYICIGEYEYTLLELLENPQSADIEGLYPNKRRALLDVNDLPLPEDMDVSRLSYGCPGEPSSEYLEVQMYGSRGCPFGCNFCVARNIYYNRANWRPRATDKIVREIIHLKNKYPAMEGVFFDEEVHNGGKNFTMELTNAIVEAKLNDLKYEAMCDVRFLDEEILRAMKKAGYYKLRIGIETASEKVMQGINKRMDVLLVRQRLQAAKELGIKTYGTFIFGARGSDDAEDTKTIVLIKDFIQNNLLDNLQISICTPQPGTPFYEYVKNNNFLRKNARFDEYDGGNSALINYPGYDYKKIKKMKERALSVRDHYFLKAKINDSNFQPWIVAICRRYGIIGLFFKMLRRLKTEFGYQCRKLLKSA